MGSANNVQAHVQKSQEHDRSALAECLLAWGLLTALTAGLFRHHLSGTLIFFGNADRLNNNLKVLKHYVDGLAEGHLNAWSDIELLGYDTFSLPYIFPNPFTYLTYWLGPENIYITAGFISAILLLLAGVTAYATLREFTYTRLVALTGAVLYQFSTLSVLKASQNNMSFAVFILIPLLLITIKRIQKHKLATSYAILSLLLFVLLQFTFLQKAAYALILTASYALYRSFRSRDWRITAVFASAGATALVTAFPRIWGLVIAMSQYTRGEKERGPLEISSAELLRWFDSTILGKNFTDPTAVANGINLTEGFLAYTSSLVPIILILGIFRYRSRWFRLTWEKEGDASFFLWLVAFLFAVFAFKPVFMLVYHLFMGMDFIHARILVAGLLPIVILASLVLADLAPRQTVTGVANLRVIFSGLVIAMVLVAGIEMAAGLARGAWRASNDPPLFLDRAAITRIVLSALAASAFFALLKARFLSSVQKQTAFVALCLTICGQTLRAAEFQVNGAHTMTFDLPFRQGDFYRANQGEFQIPRKRAVEALHAILQRDAYRSVIVCNREVAGGFCAAHIGEFWRLRLADGYYGLGVPKRIAMLPWKTGLGLRHVIFDSTDSLPWPLLGFLNVKYAVVDDGVLYRNSIPENGARWQPNVIVNPDTVVPRAFFAQTAHPVHSIGDAVRSIFEKERVTDVTLVSFVEGFHEKKVFDAQGRITVSGGGDTLVVRAEPSSKPRFLVLNELYYPGWSAGIEGVPVTIYPTNAVMRGVVLPPGATEVIFRYTPFVMRSTALLLYGSGVILLLGGVMFFRRLSWA